MISVKKKFLLAVIVSCILFSCREHPIVKKDIYMPLPQRICFDSYTFDPESLVMTFYTKRNIALPSKMNCLMTVFSYCKSSVFFNFVFDSTNVTIKNNSVSVKLSDPLTSDIDKTKPTKGNIDILSDLKNKKDSIESVRIHLFFTNTYCYDYTPDFYTERPFIANVFWKHVLQPLKNNTDTLYLLNSKTPKNMWDSVLHIVDPECKKYCGED